MSSIVRLFYLINFGKFIKNLLVIDGRSGKYIREKTELNFLYLLIVRPLHFPLKYSFVHFGFDFCGFQAISLQFKYFEGVCFCY